MAKYLNLADLKVNSDYLLPSLSCRLKQKKIFSKDVGKIEMTDNGNFKFIQNEQIFSFDIENDEQENLLRNFFQRGFVNLAQVVPMDNEIDLSFHLYVIFFSTIRNIGELSIIVRDDILDKLKKRKFINTKEDKIDGELKQMSQKFYLGQFLGTDKKFFACVQSDEYFIASAENDDSTNFDKGDENDFDDDTENNVVENTEKKSLPIFSSEIFSNPPKKSLQLFGKSFILSAGLYEDPATEQVLAVAQKITFSRKNLPCMQLACGNLTFTLEKKYSSELVKNLMHRDNTYIKLWNLYADKEGEFLVKKVRKIGLIAYEPNVQFTSDGGVGEIILTVKSESLNLLDFLKTGDSLCTSDTLPIFIEKPEMTWSDYQEYLSQKSTGDVKVNDNISGRYEIVKIDKAHQVLFLKPIGNTKLFQPQGYLFFDDTGDRMQIFRRQAARSKIENGTSANPYLGLIIGGSDEVENQLGGFLTAKTAKKDVPALTERVRQKFFNVHSATENQETAIKIALNTPDIAIIQGPPGTGKTTVITAILERLNELADKKQLQRGQVLVTSLQHDAVKNVIKRVSINSLPTIKFGTRSRDEKDFDDISLEWRERLIEKIREKNPELRENEQQTELEQLFNFYTVNPTNANAISFLDKARVIVTDKEILQKIEDCRKIFKPEPDTKSRSDLISLIRKLRTKNKSFADDGAEVADLLLYQLKDKLDLNDAENKKIIDTLTAAADCFDSAPSKDLLEELWNCKNILLRRCMPKPNYREPTLSTELIDLHANIKNFLAKPSDSDKLNNVLYNFLRELENNPEVIHECLKDYAFAFAATAQQSESREIKSVKGKQPEYDTVIVDEAARVNPGDLMIPLSQAKSRIIMVGDHRQLPHMYDEEIFEQLNESGMEINPLNIKESMFEYLLRRAKKLQERDNIPRFITLNSQYRMHPELGNFVSRNFYEPYGEEFNSPLGAEFFQQSLEANPMLWIHLPGRRGKMVRVNSSPCRACEAELIVERIKKYRAQMSEKKLSIGVISFYRSQVENIKSRLRSCGLHEEVSVGTVDAFQGMEFDIIFLSVVRTDIHLGGKTLDDLERDENSFADDLEKEKFQLLKEKIGRANYGFLTSKNRLCVALSRQKKLLIVVGDADLFRGEIGGRLAGIFVPELKNFYELCESKGAVETENA